MSPQQQKHYASWVLWMLTEEHKSKYMGAAFVVTGDETWGSCIISP
jgi:hypothetical protein